MGKFINHLAFWMVILLNIITVTLGLHAKKVNSQVTEINGDYLEIARQGNKKKFFNSFLVFTYDMPRLVLYSNFVYLIVFRFSALINWHFWGQMLSTIILFYPLPHTATLILMHGKREIYLAMYPFLGGNRAWLTSPGGKNLP